MKKSNIIMTIGVIILIIGIYFIYENIATEDGNFLLGISTIIMGIGVTGMSWAIGKKENKK